MSRSPNTWLPVAIALIAGGLFSMPLLLLLAARGSYLPFACESLSFRYFLSARIAAGEGRGAWLPQGQLVSLAQHYIFAALHFRPALDLAAELQLYAIGTSVVVGLAMLSLYIIAILDSVLSLTDKLFVLLLGPATVMGTVNAGFYYVLLPDYYAVDLVIISTALYLALHYYRDRKTVALRDLIVLGLMLGLALANKLTLGGPVGLAVLLALLGGPIRSRVIFLQSILVGFTALCAWAGVFIVLYEFKPLDAWDAAVHAVNFARTARSEANFWPTNFITFWRGYGYERIFVFWVIANLLVAVQLLRSRSPRTAVAWLANLAVVALLGLGLAKRGAGTTLFEVMAMVAGLGALMVAIALPCSARRTWSWILPVTLAGACFQHFDLAHNWSVVRQSRELARVAWEIRSRALRAGQPAVIIIPDRSYYVGGSYEELLQTAFYSGQFSPTSNQLTAHYLPQTLFRTDPGTLVTGTTVIWFEKWDQVARRPSIEVDPQEAARWSQLTRLRSMNESRSWRLGYSGEGIVRVCSITRLP